MREAEFDKFADEYYEQHARNIAVTGESPEYFARYKVADTRRWVQQAGLGVGSILDFGTGIGNSIPHFHDLFPQSELICADVSERSLEIARRRYGTDYTVVVIRGDRLPMQDEGVDLAFTACVFHHIEHEQHVHWLGEIRRVLRPGGMLVLFEHNPMNPLTARAVDTCPFDENAKLIPSKQLARRCTEAGFDVMGINYRVFFPRLLALLRPLEHYMYRIPLGAQYAIVARMAVR